jgi:hypothetical protein
MTYEARRPARLSAVLAILCALLSTIGFAVAGVIPTGGEAYPLTGWGIVIACFAISAIFLNRAIKDPVQARADASGLWSILYSETTIPWDAIEGINLLRIKRQAILRVKLRNATAFPPKPGVFNAIAAIDNKLAYGDFGINPTYYDHGIQQLVATVQHYRPDLTI